MQILTWKAWNFSAKNRLFLGTLACFRLCFLKCPFLSPVLLGAAKWLEMLDISVLPHLPQLRADMFSGARRHRVLIPAARAGSRVGRTHRAEKHQSAFEIFTATLNFLSEVMDDPQITRVNLRTGHRVEALFHPTFGKIFLRKILLLFSSVASNMIYSCHISTEK